MAEETGLYERFARGYQKSEIIFEEGAAGSEMFIIHRGRVKIVKRTEDGQEKTLRVLEPGDFFGELALIDFSRRSASAVAEEDGTQLLVLDGPKFAYLVQQLPEFSVAIMQKLSQRLRDRDLQ